MYWDVKSVQPLEYLLLKVSFIDGMTGMVRFLPEHLYGVFDALKDPSVFNQVYVDNGIVTWPGDIDLAPDAMYDAIKKHGEWVLK